MVDNSYISVAQEEFKNNDSKRSDQSQGFGARHTQALLLFLSLSIAIMIRAQLTVSIVAMTNLGRHTVSLCDQNVSEIDYDNYDFNFNVTVMPEYLENWTYNETYDTNDSENDSLCIEQSYTNSSTKFGVIMSYDWNKATQEMIIYSFVTGYTSMMVPVGLLVQKLGWKSPVAFALFTNGILSMLTPWMVTYGGWIALCILRFVQGMTQSCFFPSIHTMLAKWSPISERGRLSSFIYTGIQIGTVVALSASGALAESATFSWLATFWLCGLLCFICFGLVVSLGIATPQEHPTISKEELLFITKTRSVLSKKRSIPWKHIFTSSAVWALIVSQIGSTMTYLFSSSEVPLYMSNVLKIDLKNTGIFSSLPYIMMYFTNLLFGYLADYCVQNNYLKILNIRRIANTVGLVVAGLFLLAFTYVDNIVAALTLLILYLSLHSAIYVGFHINHVDLAPDFAGTLMAVANMLGHLGSLLVPMIVSNIVGDDVTNRSKWQVVTMILLAIQIAVNLVFVIFAKTDVQSWNYSDNDKRRDSLIEELKIHGIPRVRASSLC